MKSRACLLVAAISISGSAIAQPRVLTLVSPTQNAGGWVNSPALIRYFCEPSASCPAAETIASEGRGQIVTRTATDAAGRETTIATTLNIDSTAPDVTVLSPSDGSSTPASVVQVNARVVDALSGVATATCNGQPARIDPAGLVQCTVTLGPGINEIVVEASDQANNSGSAGIRVTRGGPASGIRILPEALSILVGQTQALQVIDDFGRPVPDVSWRVDNFRVLGIAEDGTHRITAKAPGAVTVTAMHEGLSFNARITVYAETGIPAQAERWRAFSMSSIQLQATSESPATATQSTDGFISLERPPGRPALLMAINQNTGQMPWMETPPLASSERSVFMRSHVIGGALMVVQSADGASTLVRAGPTAQGSPWRYRSPGRLYNRFVQDPYGTIVIVETWPDGFQRVVAIDGKSGRVRDRLHLGGGVFVARNVGCVEGANTVKEVPPIAGVPTIQPDGSLTFPIVHVNDLEDSRVCGQVTGYWRRVLRAARIGMNGAVLQTLAEYEVAPGGPEPRILVYPIVSDGRDGQLIAWNVRYGVETTPPQPHLVRLSPEGRQDFTVPAIGPITPFNKDLAAMLDGTTLVAFHMVTGQIQWTRVFSKGGARLVSTKSGTLFLEVPGGNEMLDEFGRRVP